MAILAVEVIHKRFDGFVGRSRIKGSHEHQTLGQLRIKVVQCQDAVHTVATEEFRAEASHGRGLFQNQRRLRIVDGQENHIRAGIFGFLNLHREVGFVIRIKGIRRNDLQLLSGRFGFEALIDTGRIRIGVIINDSNFGRQFVTGDVFGRFHALVGVGEAHAERVVVFHALGRRTGGSQLEHIVRFGFVGNSHAGVTGNRTHQQVHAPVFQIVVRIDGFFRIVFIILEFEFDLHTGDTARFVDLFNSHFGAVFNSFAINSRSTGGRSDTTDLQNLFHFVACCTTSCGGHQHGRCYQQRANLFRFHTKTLLD